MLTHTPTHIQLYIVFTQHTITAGANSYIYKLCAGSAAVGGVYKHVCIYTTGEVLIVINKGLRKMEF